MASNDRTALVESRSDVSSLRVIFKKYYYLTKPGIIRGNLLTAGAGFLLAAQGTVHIRQLVALCVGLALVIAAGCVCNNYLDRALDLKMARTARRALVTGSIGNDRALVFAAILGVSGSALLALGDNLLTAVLAAAGFVAYVVIYGIAKRHTVHSTVIGSISGAIPPLVGYAAIGHGLDLGAVLLFVVLVCWQMPHFYAIALYRYEDYKSAGLPVLPVVKGFVITKAQIIVYTVLFVLAVGSMSLAGITSIWFGTVMTVLGSGWLLQAIRGLRQTTDDSTAHWARQFFGSSLLLITIFCIAIGVNSFL